MTAPADSPRCADHRVELAREQDAYVLSQVIAAAFRDLDVSRWLVPNPDARRLIFPDYFGIYVERAFANGVVYTTAARDAAALWILADGPGEPSEGYAERLAAVTGRHLDRFTALDRAFDAHHPAGAAHEYLAILAVRPDRQKLGIGTALLDARHAILDRDGTPAYLEASDLDKRGIYLKHGYTDYGSPIELPSGPRMYPMMRQPASS